MLSKIVAKFQDNKLLALAGLGSLALGFFVYSFQIEQQNQNSEDDDVFYKLFPTENKETIKTLLIQKVRLIYTEQNLLQEQTIKNVCMFTVAYATASLSNLKDYNQKIRVQNMDNLDVYIKTVFQFFAEFQDIIDQVINCMLDLLDVNQELFYRSKQDLEMKGILRPTLLRDMSWHAIAVSTQKQNLNLNVDQLKDYVQKQIQQIPIQFEIVKTHLLLMESPVNRMILLNQRVDDQVYIDTNINETDYILQYRKFANNPEILALNQKKNCIMEDLIDSINK